MTRQRKSGGKLYYGWIIAICGALVLGVTHGVVTNCFSLYIIPVSTELGVTRDAFSICTTIVNVLYALVSFLSGYVYRRFRVEGTMKVASITLPVGFFCYSFCRSLTGFYLCAVVVGISVSFLTFLPFTLIISNWFEEKRGTALGICFMGSGLGGMLMNTLTAVLLDRYGWRASYRVIGVMMLVILIVMIWFVIRATPEQMGLQPLRKKESGTPAAEISGMTVREALHTRTFYSLMGLALIIGMNSMIMGNVVAPHLCDVGHSTMYSSLVVSVYLGCLAAAKILLGRLYDKIGAIRGTAVSMLGFIAGFLGLLLSQSRLAHILILTAALGTAASNVSYPVTTLYAFGNRDYTTLYGYMMGINFVTSSIGVPLANRIYTVTGTYNPMLIVCMALSGIALLLLPLIRPFRKADR